MIFLFGLMTTDIGCLVKYSRIARCGIYQVD